MTIRNQLLLLCLATLIVGGCSSVYYGAMEKVGKHKRDILVSRVAKARDTQEDTKEQFADALEEFSALTQFDGGELEARYNALNSEFKKAEKKAADVSARNNDVERVAKALFREWQKELDQYSNERLRSSSETQMRATERRYEQLMSAMRRAESKIDPVLSVFRDQVLFLKHNLNARAIASLQSELISVETDVSQLIRAMEVSIREADDFIGQINSEL